MEMIQEMMKGIEKKLLELLLVFMDICANYLQGHLLLGNIETNTDTAQSITHIATKQPG
jgi:hypothetical protein